MASPTKRVMCSHCAERLDVATDYVGKSFECQKCGELTTIRLGAALADKTDTLASDVKKILSLVRVFMLLFGILLLANGSLLLHGCSSNPPPHPTNQHSTDSGP